MEDLGYFGDETFLEPEQFGLDLSIAYMGDPANINYEREEEEYDDYDEFEYDDLGY